MVERQRHHRLGREKNPSSTPGRGRRRGANSDDVERGQVDDATAAEGSRRFQFCADHPVTVAGIPPGCETFFWTGTRRCRYAQPPANVSNPSGMKTEQAFSLGGKINGSALFGLRLRAEESFHHRHDENLRLRNSEIPTNFAAEVIRNFSVPWYGCSPTGLGVLPPGMVPALSNQITSMIN